MAPMEICHLFISTGHNFVGHHGREPDTYPMIETIQIECVTGRGIRGRCRAGFGRCRAGSRSLARRNVITRGVNLNELIGQEFEVQGVRFLGMEECRPCYWMDSAFAPGAHELLKGRGGLRAKILTDGSLRSTARVLAATQ